MSAASWLAARREIVNRVRRRSFVVFTLLLCAGIVGGGVLFNVLDDDSLPDYDVGVVAPSPASAPSTGDAASLDEALAAAAQASEVEIDLLVLEPDDVARALDDGIVDAVIDADALTVTWQHDVSEQLATTIDAAWSLWSAQQAAVGLGLEPDEVASILAPPPLVDDVIDPDDDSALGTLVGFATAVLLFISITTFGSYVLTGVVEEKATGVIEVLLSHVRAHELMAGKVIGIGAVALVQFSAAVVAALVSLRISGIDVPREIWVGLPVTIAWFIGGFLLYSTLFALAGSFVSRVEDAQSAAAPITTAFMIGYLAVFIVGADPSGTPATVMSLLPPFAPLLMPLRMATGAASIVEIAISAALLAVAVVAMIRLAGSVYSWTLLHRGRRLTWREGLRRTDPADA